MSNTWIQPVQHATKVERAMMELITDEPFHASIILQHSLTEDNSVPTAVVNAHGDIRYNHEWFESLTIDEIVFVLCHENMHYMMMHCIRRMGRPPKKWNIACDGVINETLVATAVRSMPAKGVRWEGAEHKNAEMVFKEMFEDNQPDDEPPVTEPPPPPEEEEDDGDDDDTDSAEAGDDEDSTEDTDEDSSDEDDGDDGDDGDSTDSDEDGDEECDEEGTGPGDGDDIDDTDDESGEGGESTDDTDGDADGEAEDDPRDSDVKDWGIGEDIDDTTPLSESEKNILADKVVGEMIQARNAAKQVGKMPDLLEKFVAKLVEVKVPWYEIVSRWFTSIAQTDYTYENIDRRFIGRDMRLPFFSGKGMGISVIIVDVSLSIDRAEMDNFEAHYNDILMAGQPDLLVVLYVTTEVVGVEEYGVTDYPVQLSCTVRGCTDMTAGLDYMLEHYPTAESCIVLTDGYTPFGDPIDIPTMWAITTEGLEADWGETVYLEVA